MLFSRRLLCSAELALGVVVVASCASSHPTPAPSNPAPTGQKTADAPRSPETIHLEWASKVPDTPVVDGNPAEWGAVSRTPLLSLLVTKDRVYFVATLMGAYKAGVWIELSVPAPDLGSIGEWGGDGSFYNYENEQYGSGKEDLVAAHAVFVAWHEERFRRLYWLDAKGIQVQGEKGLESIDGAVVASKAAADGVTVEVELPLPALPRMSQAPADSFFLFATGGSAAVVPEIDPENRIEVMQKAAVAFEPLSEQRAHVAGIDLGGPKRLRFSYHPAKPTVVEFIHFRDRQNGGTY